MIQVHQVDKYYGAHRALSQVSFDIAQGEVLGFLGLNGAGKTTMLNILSGVLRPSAGTVKIAGMDAIEDAQAIRSMIGFLPDRPALYGDMPVREMLLYAARLNGLNETRCQHRLSEVVDICELHSVLGLRVDQLSLGYRQRVGIASAIIHEPKLLILDEPISGLDPEQIVAARQLIRRLAESHTVLLSSHILSEIEQSCDRIIILHQGRILADGKESEFRPQQQGCVYEFHGLGDAELARQTAQTLFSDYVFTSTQAGDEFLLAATDLGAHQRAQLVHALIQNGLSVHQIQAQAQANLEQMFLRLTREANQQGQAA